MIKNGENFRGGKVTAWSAAQCLHSRGLVIAKVRVRVKSVVTRRFCTCASNETKLLKWTEKEKNDHLNKMEIVRKAV